MTDRDRRLDRLAKLLALESSPNVHEAASARRAAEAFMAKYGLHREEASGRSPSGYYEHPMGARGWDQAWRFALVTAAARYCGAEAIVLLVGRRRKVRVAGVRSDVERAVRLYEDLLTLVLGLERSVGDDLDDVLVEEAALYGTRECADAFRRGVVLGIVGHLARSGKSSLFSDQARARTASSHDDNGKGRLALVVVRDTSQAEKIKARYEPDERSIDLDDVSAYEWFEFGLRSACHRVVVSDDGEVGLRPKDLRRTA